MKVLYPRDDTPSATARRINKPCRLQGREKAPRRTGIGDRRGAARPVAVSGDAPISGSPFGITACSAAGRDPVELSVTGLFQLPQASTAMRGRPRRGRRC